MDILDFDFGPLRDWLTSLGAWLGVIGFGWLLSVVFATIVAPRGRRLEFLVITLIILGPLGVGFAAIAQPRDPSTRGRNPCTCPRCGALQFIPSEDGEFHCWRCNQHNAVKKGVLGKRYVEPYSDSQHALGRTHSADRVATVGTSFADSSNLEVDRDLGPGTWGASPAAAASPPPPVAAGPPTAAAGPPPAAASAGEGPPLPWEAFPPGGGRSGQ